MSSKMMLGDCFCPRPTGNIRVFLGSEDGLSHMVLPAGTEAGES